MAMRLFTVHLPRRGQPGDAVLVKEGISWPALFFGPFWAAWHGLWRWAAIWIAAAALLGVIEAAWPDLRDLLGVAQMALMVLFAAEANDLQRQGLARQGHAESGVVGGSDLDTAARRYIDLAAIGAH